MERVSLFAISCHFHLEISSAKYLGRSVFLTLLIFNLHRLHVDETILQCPHSMSASIHPYSDSLELVVHRSHLVSNISMKTRGINAQL